MNYDLYHFITENPGKYLRPLFWEAMTPRILKL